MLKSVFLKEYLKVRRIWLALLALNLALMVYIALDTRHLFVMDHAEIVWYRVLHLGRIHFADLRFAPFITGLLIACVQYLPEMNGERLRLSLHLPVLPHRLVLSHVLVGLTATAIITGLDLVGLVLITGKYFPAEMVQTALVTALPWVLAGFAAYLGMTLALLEPGYSLKGLNLVITAGIAGLCLQRVHPGAYRDVLGILLVLVLFMIPAVLLPAYRFRYRKVS